MGSTSLSSMNLNHLVALDALLSEGSVAKAARRVGISASALSHTLATLRETFDDPLLVRGRDGMSLSPRAQQLAAPLREALRGIERILDQGPGFVPATTTRELRIATGDFVAARLAAELLAQMAARSPGAKLSVRPLDLSRCLDMLERGEVDLVLGPHLDAGESVEIEPWTEEPFVCCVRKDHPTVHGDEIDLDTYSSLDHILVSPTGTGSAWVDRALADRGFGRRVVCRVPSFLVAPMIVAESDLVLTAPRSAVAPFVAGLGLRLLAPPLELPALKLYASWHRRDTDDPGHRWFRTLIASGLEDAGVGPAQNART
jgi:DNA-binding transcriptional LysR family regulator